MTRLMVWNIEWMTRLFDEDGAMRRDGPENVENLERLDAIAQAIEHIDPALLGIVEGPSSPNNNPGRSAACLNNFITHYDLPHTGFVRGLGTDGSQELCIIWDPARIDTAVHNPRGTIDPDDDDFETNPRFDQRLIIDVTDDRVSDVITFYRPPLEVDVETTAGHEFTVILCHNKSKGIFNTGDMVNWERENRRNRSLLLGQAQWIRRRVDQILNLDPRREVVVMGDFNDGIGRDWFEEHIGRSSVEVIIGDLLEPDNLLRHQPGRPRWNRNDSAWEPSSTRFRDLLTEDYVRVLIDFILTSEHLPVVDDSHRIWNPWIENPITGPITAALRQASDHHPIVLDLADP